MSVPGRFRHFLAIDWSGAAGQRQHGIAAALCDAKGGPPRPVMPGHVWSREEITSFLATSLPPDTLVGLDLGISLPLVDCGAFFPGWAATPPDAKSLWALVEDLCQTDPHLTCASFIDHPVLSRYFRRHGGREGDRFLLPEADDRRGRFRVTEHVQAQQGCKPTSNFNLVGAAQVGKSSLTGMRVLHRLNRDIPVWPMDKVPPTGPVIVEIYTGLAAIEAGRSGARTKMRDYTSLNAALSALGSPELPQSGAIHDHASDALLGAAWLRNVADQPCRWAPRKLTESIAKTEGWTFGAV
ncbi:MAG: hypothetical protein ACK5NN_00870 [Sphingomonadaceae bacterium]